MSLSLSRGKTLDPGEVGLEHHQLPELGDSQEATRFDLREWWPQERRSLPFELEIGSGKGTFIVQQAPTQPDVNFLGVEYARQFWLYAADRCRRNDLSHQVRMLCIDAKLLVTWYVPGQMFRVVHVYFADPWPKKKHNKRRMIQADFLIELYRVIQDDGLIRIVTDHDDYFAWMEEHAAMVSDRFAREPFERPASADEGEFVGTNFERKYRREGRPFNAMTLRKL